MTSPEPLPSEMTDALTIAAARDTGVPGFRIVSTAPPASALPPLPPDEPSHPGSHWTWIIWCLGLTIAIGIAREQAYRMEPRLDGAELPLLEEVAWIALYIGAEIFAWVGIMAVAGVVRRAVRPDRAA